MILREPGKVVPRSFRWAGRRGEKRKEGRSEIRKLLANSSPLLGWLPKRRERWKRTIINPGRMQFSRVRIRV